MNQDKADFFDSQVGASWACGEYGAEEQPKIKRLAELAQIEPGMRVLEPGCGTGRLTELLARWVGAQGQVAALDISPAMVEACRLRLESLGDGVRLFQRSLEELDLPQASFERVICHQVFPHFDNQPLALGIMERLLAPGGLLLVVHFVSRAEINDTHRKAGTAVEADLLPGEAEMRAMMAGAGLEVDFLADDELGYALRARKA